MKNFSLRERKKNETRQTLATAAFDLALEKGVDQFVVKDIVDKAGFSRRTFANHFSCKEEAIASVLEFDRIPDSNTLSHRKEFTPLEAIEEYIKYSFSIEHLNLLHTLISLSEDHPTLKLYVTDAVKELHDFARERISDDFGDKYSEHYYHLLIGAVFGALMPILDGGIDIELPKESTNNDAFDSYLQKVFSNLREGFK